MEQQTIRDNLVKVPVVKNDRYTIYFENYKGVNFIHCDVHKWNKTTRKLLQQSFKDLKKMYQDDIYCYHYTNDRKHKKFLQLFDFELYQSGKALDGQDLEIYRSKSWAA